MGKPYVISVELDLPQTAPISVIDRNGVETFIESLDTDLRGMGKNTLWVPSGELRSGLEASAAKTKLPIASLDDRYIRTADRYIGISRGVDSDLSDAGYVPRGGYAPINKQLAAIARLGSEIVVADDVLFSGEMLSWVNTSLRPYGSRVSAVVTGIAIREGVEKLKAEGIDVEATYMFKEVEDEICLRDFGIVPGSGRRVTNGTNALYFDPEFGRPAQWASLEEDQVIEFGVASLQRSLNLLKPNIPIRQVGSFLGYSTNGTVQEAIMSRLELLQ